MNNLQKRWKRNVKPSYISNLENEIKNMDQSLRINSLENSTKENMMEIAHLKKTVSNNEKPTVVETKEKFKWDKCGTMKKCLVDKDSYISNSEN
jgi:hypothetical protein